MLCEEDCIGNSMVYSILIPPFFEVLMILTKSSQAGASIAANGITKKPRLFISHCPVTLPVGRPRYVGNALENLIKPCITIRLKSTEYMEKTVTSSSNPQTL